MKIAFIGNYPPRMCGIATFTNNLVKSIVANTDSKNIEDNAVIIAINEEGQEYDYPEEVKFVIRQNHQRDYIEAAKFINLCGAELCILEHEFGIFGGDDGVYILSLLHRLKIPYISTFHTVLKTPSYTQRSIVEEIGREASRIVVMSKKAVGFLTELYNISKDKVVIIEHGVPEFEKISRDEVREKLALSDRKVILTFGFLSKNKGLETVINALPEVVKKHPDTLYIILGATHPNVLKHFGEEYRNQLILLVKKHNLENNVYFNNQFVSEQALIEYLFASDVYVTPYLNEAQITSGTLSYAIGAGSAVVSTPYWHAQELLDDGRGILFDFNNHNELSNNLIELFDNKNKLKGIRKKAFDYGKKIRWPKIGKQYLFLSEYIVYNLNLEIKKEIKLEDQPIDVRLLPSYNMEHIYRLTDDTGIVQHAKYGIPNLKEGYCVDDNARAIIMSLMAYRQKKDTDILKLTHIYLSFIQYMQLDNGDFRNFLSFSRQYLDESGTEDSFGRTVWSLGYLIRFSPSDALREIGKEIFRKTIQNYKRLKSLRGSANTIIGICYYLKDVKSDEGVEKELARLVKFIVEEYKKCSDDKWKWYEDILTYDNALIPLSLLLYYDIDANAEVLNIALESIEFLESHTMKKDYYMVVGNEGWLKRGEKMAEYDQQSIDTMAMILLYYQLFQIKKDKKYLERMFKCYLWFLGENSLRLPLFDHETKGCCDGLEKYGLNRNQGAESTLAYWISHLAVLFAQEKEHIAIKK